MSSHKASQHLILSLLNGLMVPAKFQQQLLVHAADIQQWLLMDLQYTPML